MMCNRLHLQAGHGKRVWGLSYSRYVQIHSGLHRAKPKPQPKPKPIPEVEVDIVQWRAPVPDFLPTPQPVIDAALAILHPAPADVLCDLGCGDGRVLITAAKTYGCRAIGVEHNPHNVALAKRNVKAAGVEDLVTIVEGDAREYDLEGVTVVWMYLDADLIAELEPKLASVRCVVSYHHPLPGVDNEEVVIGGTDSVYFWIQTHKE
jgi:SAM-dependent methyltransferase